MEEQEHANEQESAADVELAYRNSRTLLVRGIRKWDQILAHVEEELASGDAHRRQTASRDLRVQLGQMLRTLAPEAMAGLIRLFRRQEELALKLMDRQRRYEAPPECK